DRVVLESAREDRQVVERDRERRAADRREPAVVDAVSVRSPPEAAIAAPRQIPDEAPRLKHDATVGSREPEGMAAACMAVLGTGLEPHPAVRTRRPEQVAGESAQRPAGRAAFEAHRARIRREQAIRSKAGPQLTRHVTGGPRL